MDPISNVIRSCGVLVFLTCFFFFFFFFFIIFLLVTGNIAPDQAINELIVYHIHPKYWDTLTPYHNSPKI